MLLERAHVEVLLITPGHKTLVLHPRELKYTHIKSGKYLVAVHLHVLFQV
jgi:hypothetical protein